ncbi:helix-turn-helix domain-containing protein [Yinghuangia seranimata]|uniref:helix-turn-helix domain-containing protein n=1 Tax=Yinghuangia seranimata TaxID=408067 RepID=UPI00248B8A2B|nr:helix-turn-helix transcriptional regulator [Yinghuangia seranimata]MDI2126572.1 helix-turn-helix transcriptional regulator [Yinghuangia seranimata]
MTAEKDIDPDESPWHLLAYELREHRKTAGMTQAQLATRAHSSESHVGSVETVHRRPQLDTIRAYDNVLNARGRLLRLYRMARRATQGLPAWFAGYTKAEEAASRIRTYEPQVVPGLLQVEGYARELFRQVRTPPDEIDDLAATRLLRQEIFTRSKPPDYWAVLDEAALQRLAFVPSPVAVEQLTHLLKVSELANVTVEVLPVDCGLHACMNGGFVLLTVPERGEVAYEEGVGEGRLIADDQAVDKIERRYDLLRAETLSPRRSAQYMRDVLENL